VTPPNLSDQALRDIYQAVDDMIASGAGPAYAERFAVAAAETAEKIARRPLLGHRRSELLPGKFRFWAVRGFDYLLVYNAEHPERRVLRVVHMARDLGPLLVGISLARDPEET
jgi:plasmid stabilization system protein ParE